ncbi:telomere length regulation protein TEL2 homolog [Chenopodium quinoa]|uniref:telomere length regulation protein TEL2 homolog n=1 Tax=Chenopodium quinoa TaxID=63459 RepID=UPI000B77B9CD|nr:telomere length regulation protein TEL2 homolog [Chenopodium quinoa]
MAMEVKSNSSVPETQLLEKISAAISAITTAKYVDDVILTLHSVAILIFPVDTSSLSGVISERYRDQLNQLEVPYASEGRNHVWEVFYKGVSFPTLARFLIHDVASNWLSCFPLTARKLVYDVFFVKGLIFEVVQALIPSLNHSTSVVRSNTERLVALCLLENEGALQLAKELDVYHESNDNSASLVKLTVSRVAQLVASVPDKTRPGALKSLSSHLFFKSITIQLLDGAEEKSRKLYGKEVYTGVDGSFLFVAEMFARICRRGSADLLVSEVIPRIHRRVRNLLSSHDKDIITEKSFKSDPSFQFWLLMIGTIKDAYVLEKMTEQILHQLVYESANDTEAYWILWILFHQSFQHQTTVRVIFVDKFLLLKVLPFCCLRWILQFAVFGCPFDDGKLKKSENNHVLLEAVSRVVQVWSTREFVQSSPLEQQFYVTAVAGLLLENMSREELDSTKDVMRLILEGVSCRLENPDELVRKMASNVALVFSKVVDPKNPLYLDDSCREENVDWEFGLPSSMGALSSKNRTSNNVVKAESNDKGVHMESQNHGDTHERESKLNPDKKKPFELMLVDPDEIVDPASLNDEFLTGEEVDDNASEDSESSSDSSLQPYDLTDDDSDLKKRISQLVDVVGALRKSDDPDGVERALDVAEKLVRASPDELRHVASDLVRTLVQVRCTDSVVEEEEDSAEEKRQKALVALLVTCPFESVNTVNKLLYSPHLDVSQRIMILDVMTDAAEELANAKTIVRKTQPKSLISSASEPQLWFLPSSKGPTGAGSWKEIPDTLPFSSLNLTNRFERELPSKSVEIKGKTRRWGHNPANLQGSVNDWSQNKFPLYAAAFMLPAMQGFDKKSHGVDLLGRDFLVLGKLIYMLGVCVRCIALHPEASTLAPALLDMLRSREVCQHKEAFVRRSVLFAISCCLNALHPSFIASSLMEGNEEISRGLEWVRTWALQIAESDTDRECCTMAMACLQLHAQMSLQASRAFNSAESSQQKQSIGLPSNLAKGVIRIPGSNSFLG